jgi:hypothetical protein
MRSQARHACLSVMRAHEYVAPLCKLQPHDRPESVRPFFTLYILGTYEICEQKSRFTWQCKILQVLKHTPRSRCNNEQISRLSGQPPPPPKYRARVLLNIIKYFVVWGKRSRKDDMRRISSQKTRYLLKCQLSPETPALYTYSKPLYVNTVRVT